MKTSKWIARLIAGVGCLAIGSTANAAVFDLTIDGTDAIFLAGRTDLVIPPANQPWGDNNPATFDGMLRHSAPTPEELQETLPPTISLGAGDVVKVVDPAVGGVSFFNKFGGVIFGPEGNGVPGSSNLTAFAGISGYIGTQGALTGVFLSDDIPNGATPATLDFSTAGLGVNFLSLTPGLGQVFFIGDGQTNGGIFQEFIAPTGATRLALGVPDGFSFNGVPGAYDDNDGAYRIRVGVNETPIVPIPAAFPLLAGGLGLLGLFGWRRKRVAAV